MSLTRPVCFLFLLASIASPSLASAVNKGCVAPDCISFPADSGYLNVRDFGAKGDGVHDDTAAIRAALNASGADLRARFWKDKIVYLPNGTYLVSDRIEKRYEEGRFASGTVLVGQSREGTVIRLKDRAEGYGDSAEPKAVIFTSAKLLDGNATSGGKDYTNKGEGNDAYHNYIENLTVDVGAGNPGAIGIDYLANNMGAIRRVVVRAPVDSGVVGIGMTRKWPGPCLLKDVTVKGFDVGIDVGNTEYGVTLDTIRLENQWSIGLRNTHNMVSARNLIVKEVFQPVLNAAEDGLIVLVGGSLERQETGGEAISNAGSLTMRGLRVKGYATLLGAPVLAAPVSGAYSQNKLLPGTVQEDWALEVKEPPQVFGDPDAKWVSVTKFGAQPDAETDSTEAIRKAFTSGANTVYFPNGTYRISDNIIVPLTVRRIVGMNSTITAFSQRKWTFDRNRGMFRIMNSKFPLTIEKLAFDHSDLGDQVAIEATGLNPVVLRDIVGAGVTTLRRTATGNEVYVENTCCGYMEIAGPKGVWAWQLNTEGFGARIRNWGSPLWILGLKTEWENTAIENNAGARTEVLGGLVYMVKWDPSEEIPAFRNTDGKFFGSYVEESFSPRSTYVNHLIETKQGKVTKIRGDAMPKRSNEGRIVPNLVSD